MMPFYTQNNYYNPTVKDGYLVNEIIVTEELNKRPEEIEYIAQGVYSGGRREGIWKIYAVKGNLLREDGFEKGEYKGSSYFPVPKFPSKEDKRREFLALMDKRNLT